MRIIPFWLLLLPLPGLGQENTPDRPPYTLKTAPLNLVNPYQQSVDLHADIPLSSRWGLDIGTGVLVHSEVFAQYRGESFWGLKLQPGIKYYIRQSDRHNNYVALVFKYISVNNERYVTAGRQGNQYAEWLLLQKRLVTHGLSMRFGSQRYLGQRRRVILEPYIGLGWRQLRITDEALPPGAELLGSNSFFVFQRQPGVYPTADFMLGFYLGWRL